MKSAEEIDVRWTRNFNATQLRTWLKEQAVAYLGGKCRGCGYHKCLAALDFHHRNPREKDFEISSFQSTAEAGVQNTQSAVRLQRELDKCVLLCKNCHAETHAGLHPQFIDVAREEDAADEYDLYVAAV